MGDEYRRTGTGWPPEATPRAVAPPPDVPPDAPPDAPPDVPPDVQSGGRRGGGAGRLTPAGALIGVLLALFGFTVVVLVKSNSTDQELVAARDDDLVRILSDLQAREERLRQDIATLESSQRQLTSGVQGRQAALQEAARRADELGVLAGTLPARGPGLEVRLSGGSKPIDASALLNTVQELRGSGAEAMQISGAGGPAVRVVASTYFVDVSGGVVVDGTRLVGPFTVLVIGQPSTMQPALKIKGGVTESVAGDGGNVIVQEHEAVDVTALRGATRLQHARPVS